MPLVYLFFTHACMYTCIYTNTHTHTHTHTHTLTHTLTHTGMAEGTYHHVHPFLQIGTTGMCLVQLTTTVTLFSSCNYF